MKYRLALGIAGVAGLTALACALLAPGRLTIGGKTIETTFIVQGGRTFVPLADVARAMGTTVQKAEGGFALAPVGAGSMVTGLEGKVGQTLGTSQMQFTVRSVVEADKEYKRQFGDGAVDAYDDNARLVIVLCRVRNATSKTISICTVGASKTALADTDEHTYEVLTGDGPRNADILPGSVIDFGLVFKVPKSEKLKALVYQTDGFPQQKIFRISLAKSDE